MTEGNAPGTKHSLPSVHNETIEAMEYILTLIEDSDARWYDKTDRYHDVYSVCADPYCDAVRSCKTEVGPHGQFEVDITVHKSECKMDKTINHIKAFVEVEKQLHREAEQAGLPGFTKP